MVSRLTLNINAAELKKIDFDNTCDELSRACCLATELCTTAKKVVAVKRETITSWKEGTSLEACVIEATAVAKEAVSKFEVQYAVFLKIDAAKTTAYEAYMKELARSWCLLQVDKIS